MSAPQDADSAPTPAEPTSQSERPTPGAWPLWSYALIAIAGIGLFLLWCF